MAPRIERSAWKEAPHAPAATSTSRAAAVSHRHVPDVDAVGVLAEAEVAVEEEALERDARAGEIQVQRAADDRRLRSAEPRCASAAVSA